MDERILAILKEVARGDLSNRDDGFEYFCPHCSYEMMAGLGEHPVPHDADCIVTVARTLLREMGQPMKLYKLEWELHGPQLPRPAGDDRVFIHLGNMGFPPQCEEFLYAHRPDDIDIDAEIDTHVYRPRDQWGEVTLHNVRLIFVCDV